MKLMSAFCFTMYCMLHGVLEFLTNTVQKLLTSGCYGLFLTGTFSAALRLQKSRQLKTAAEPCVNREKQLLLFDGFADFSVFFNAVNMVGLARSMT